MAQTDTGARNSFWGAFFASPEEKLARRKQKDEARRTQREADRQAAKDMRDSGQFSENVPDSFFYRHYYF